MTQGRETERLGDARRTSLWALAALVAIPLLFHSALILGGKEPAAPDTMAVRPLGVWALETARTLGETPLWIPCIFSGMPSYGSYIHTPASVLSPLDPILRLFADSRGARYFILLLIGGISAFFFIRRQGTSAPAAAAAALAFVMTPYIPGVIEAGHSTKLRALMHVPLFLLAFDALLDRARPLTAALLALAAAMLGWANHPQILYYAGLVAAVYAIGRVIAERGEWGGRRLLASAVWIVASAAIAGLLLAEPTLAVREYAPYSIRGASDGGGASWEYATAWSFDPKELITFLFPGFFGYTTPVYFGPLPMTQSSHSLGLIVLLLAGFGFYRARDRRGWVWLGVSAIVLIIGFGEHLPILYRPMYEVLPYFNKFRVPSMIYALLPIAVGYLVARGLDAMAAPPRTQRAGRPAPSGRPWLVAAGLLLGLAVLILIISVATKSGAIEGSAFQRPEEAGRIAPAQLSALRGERWGQRLGSVVTSLVFAAALCAAVPFARRMRRPLGVALLGGLLVAELWIVGVHYVDYVDRARVEASLRATPEIEFLKRQPGPFRVLPLDEFTSNRFAAFGIETVGGYQPAKLKIYQDLIESQILMTPSVLSMLNVRYLLASEDPGHESFVRVADGVYEYVRALPRAWFVSSWRRVSDDGLLLRAMTSRDFDPAVVALVPASETPDLPAGGLPTREVEVKEITAHRLRLQVADGEGPGLLVVSEIHYLPGWSATIDGVAAPILRVNHCLRGMVVPAGEHAIEMRMDSAAFRRGRLLNRVGGGTLLLLAAVGILLDRRRSKPVG